VTSLGVIGLDFGHRGPDRHLRRVGSERGFPREQTLLLRKQTRKRACIDRHPRPSNRLPVRNVTLDSLIAAGYDSRLTAFDVLLPPLIGAYDRLSAGDPRRAALEGPVAALRAWDHRTRADSVPTALAIFWGRALIESARARESRQPIYDYLVDHLSDAQRLNELFCDPQLAAWRSLVL
jgi:penicillin amidase